VQGNSAFLILFAVGLLDTFLLYRFFTVTLPALKLADPEVASRLTDDAAHAAGVAPEVVRT
jgi:hypothetical protein